MHIHIYMYYTLLHHLRSFLIMFYYQRYGLWVINCVELRSIISFILVRHFGKS